MKKILSGLFLSALLLASVCSCSTEPADANVAAASALAKRVVGAKAGKIVFQSAPADTADYFVLESKGSKIVISGNSANSMAVGLNHYLKYYCNVEFGWLLNDTFEMPSKLPKVAEPVKVYARVPERFFLNYCTYGYTMPWWQWQDWEHFIDWMALNGVNLPLAITGQESIWYQIWTEMGLTDEEVRNYFTGPSHLPWHRMQNIDRWFAPLPQCWLDEQLELQKKITARERELNMRPVLPAFAGHVPRDLARIYPDAPMTQLEAWSGYQDEYACTFLDPMSDLYTEIQKKFVEKETEIYGTDHVYGIDIFNELMPPSWEPDYLGRVSRQVYESLQAADPDATWLQMGWLFYNERKYWTNDRVEAYLTSFPTDRQILLDYYCERMEVWQRTESFYGVPYVWCYLGNFGGNTFLCGQFDEIDKRIENTFVNGGKNFKGIGATLEGFDCNPYIYEYILEKAWHSPMQTDLNTWIDALADQRVGKNDQTAREAWRLLIDSVYVQRTTPGQSNAISQRPNFERTKTYYGNSGRKYRNELLKDALGMLLEVESNSTAYAFDVANLTRQMLANHFDKLKGEYAKAYKEGNREEMKALSQKMIEIIADVDDVIGTQTYFLVGKWISDARSWGVTDEEKDYFEENARNLITTWSDADMLLNDYASRQWNGLTGSMYKVRWEKFFAAVEACMDEGAEWDDDHYKAFSDDVTAFEKSWWADRLGTFSSVPVGDSKAKAKELFAKYAEEI
ncbi:MAG: alpha-N-acetylglucosaminidase [Bacteroidales bacterium]|nr:alpha-N-acetylglucosaminidase [Bacteroidales bacterium]